MIVTFFVFYYVQRYKMIFKFYHLMVKNIVYNLFLVKFWWFFAVALHLLPTFCIFMKWRLLKTDVSF
ncbi:hypothetical protein B0A58_00990 [Flavobacterium branchiophilum NBRC 15030 = ATCC 35035]|nr:hypothetical protein B0A58_00990 [Flavobacterium branchiophilum NBRC 15030 = ATCC 35035]